MGWESDVSKRMRRLLRPSTTQALREPRVCVRNQATVCDSGCGDQSVQSVPKNNFPYMIYMICTYCTSRVFKVCVCVCVCVVCNNKPGLHVLL